MRRPISIAIALLALSSTANAGPKDVSHFLSDYDSANPGVREVLEVYVSGEEQGLLWANVSLEVERHQPPFYCERDAVPDPKQVIDMLRADAKEYGSFGRLLLGQGVMRALEQMFPCPQHK